MKTFLIFKDIGKTFYQTEIDELNLHIYGYWGVKLKINIWFSTHILQLSSE